MRRVMGVPLLNRRRENRRALLTSFFCTSTCDRKIAGDDADTGTPPDSAPQTPLNVA